MCSIPVTMSMLRSPAPAGPPARILIFVPYRIHNRWDLNVAGGCHCWGSGTIGESLLASVENDTSVKAALLLLLQEAQALKRLGAN